MPKRRSLLIGSAALAATPLAMAPLTAFASAELGTPAPDFVGTDSNGKKWPLADLKGKVVVIEVTNHDCPYVRKHYNSNNMQTQQREAAAKGVVWLSLVASGPGREGFVEGLEANELTKSRNAHPAAVLLDPEGTIARAYGATVTPHMFVIDAKGMLVYKGGIDSIRSSNPDDVPKAKQYVRLALAEVLDGKPVSEASTRPYG
jgi:peroxiredoxin